MSTNWQTASTPSFQKKVWLTVGITAFAVIVIWILKASFNVLLLILTGALIALYFQGLSGLIQRNLHLSKRLSLVISIVGSLLLVVLFFWFAGSSIQQQINELSQTLPSSLQKLKAQLNDSSIGRQIMKLTSSQESSKTSAMAQRFFQTTFGVLGDFYVVLIVGIFFTVTPKTYINGFLSLMPPAAKNKAADILDKTGDTLTKWLKGQLFAMLVVAVLTAIGLFIIGLPMALVLALIAGILNFIPNFGPLIAIIPAVLVAMLQGPTTALLVAGLYIVVQVLESSIITPQIQKKMINMPPALIIIAQLFMGVLTGSLGLILATPITAILIVVVQELYTKKIA